MTRRKISPQKEKIRNSPLSHRVTKSGLQFNVRKPIQKHYYTATGGSRKSIKDSRDFMTTEFRSNKAEIKNQLNEMQSKLEVLTTKVNEVEERVSDMEDKLMARKEAEEKRENN